MADDPKAKDKGAASPAESAPAAAPAKKLLGGKNLIVLIVMIAVLGGGAGFWMHHSKQKHAEESGAEPVAQEEATEIQAFDPIVVNVMGTQGTRYLKVSVSLELSSTALQDYLTEFADRKVQLTDRLNAILSSKSLDQLDSPAHRDEIKRELRDELQGVLSKKPGSIKNVYFTDFVVQ